MGFAVVHQAAADENIIRLSTELKNKSDHALSYQFMSYQRSDDYKGFQNIFQHQLTLGDGHSTTSLPLPISTTL